MFQQRLFTLRKERGISQEELADIVGVSRQAVQKWESGASRPDMDNLTAISRYFGVSLDYLITGVEVPAAAPASPQPVCWPGWHYEYQSKATLFGLPLVHINWGSYGNRRARGVIAIGNIATGGIAFGGLSVGILSLGGVGLGGITLGGLSAGVLAIGGLALGLLGALGGLALSFGLAVGGCAFSGAYAFGGVATAAKIASGGVASAYIAIGDTVNGVLTFPKDDWGPGTADAIRAAIQQTFPHTPSFLTDLFSVLR